MHPAIRIVTCICLIGVIVRASNTLLVYISLVLLAFALLYNPGSLYSAIKISLRLKWLLGSIAMLYLWMIPGDPLIATSTDISSLIPSKQGFWMATQRISVLLLVIISVQMLIIGVAKDRLYVSISWLMTPLEKLGVPTRTFSVRCALCIDEIQNIRTSIKTTIKLAPHGSRIKRAVDVLAMTYSNALHENEKTNKPAIQVDSIARPTWYQWLIPALIIIVPYLLTRQGIVA